MANLASLRARLANIKEHSEEMMGYGLQTAETFAAGFAAGYVNQKFGTNGELTVQGVPVDLLVGLGLSLGGIGGMFGKHGGHAVNIGAGCLASYGTRLGQHTASQ